jgi:ABC-type antimicrobial peptide transport system permease subunit
MAPLSLSSIGLVTLFAGMLGLLAAVPPMWRVRRLAIVDALRHEG